MDGIVPNQRRRLGVLFYRVLDEFYPVALGVLCLFRIRSVGAIKDVALLQTEPLLRAGVMHETREIAMYLADREVAHVHELRCVVC